MTAPDFATPTGTRPPAMTGRRGASALWGSLAAHVLSTTGTRISAVAMPWFVLTSTGSATKTGLVALAETAPLVVAMALTGPMIDRVGSKRVSVAADAASFAVVGVIPLLHLVDRLTFPILLVLVAGAGLLRGPGEAAKATMVPDIAEAAAVPLERVTGFSGSSDRLAMIVGPAVAGALIAVVGPVNAIAIDAVSFAVCAGLVAVFTPYRPGVPPEPSEGGYGRQLRNGWRFLVNDRLLRTVVMIVAVTNLLDAAYSAVLLPVWVRSHGYGAAQLGLIGSTFGLTATVASVLAAIYGTRLPRRLVFLVGFAVAGAPRFVALALGLPLWAVLAVGAVAGFGSGFINPILGAVFIQRIPRALLGRVGGVVDGLCWIGIPIGGVAAGLAVAAAGLAPTLLVAGAVYLLVTTAPARRPQWRELDARPAAETDVGPPLLAEARP